jgi:hypothetical protein
MQSKLHKECALIGSHACRYVPGCTLLKANPGIAFAPAPEEKFIITKLPPTSSALQESTLSSSHPASPGIVSAFSTGRK